MPSHYLQHLNAAQEHQVKLEESIGMQYNIGICGLSWGVWGGGGGGHFTSFLYLLITSVHDCYKNIVDLLHIKLVFDNLW